MPFARDQRIIPRYCQECGKKCREVDLFIFPDNKGVDRKLCGDCFWELEVGIENPNKWRQKHD